MAPDSTRFNKTLTLKRREEKPDRLRFIERKGRYILQELVDEISASLSGVVKWRDVPLVKDVT